MSNASDDPFARFREDDYILFLPFVAKAETPAYSFLVAGHTYGKPGVNNPGLHPPFKTLISQINAQSLDWGMLTGDIVIGSTATEWDEVDADLAQLNLPVHFTVGNHDISNRDLFVSRYGPTYYSFDYKGDLFITLDSELDPCNISGEQITFLQNTLNATSARNIFIFVHKLIWIVEDTPYYVLRNQINGPSGYNFHNNFWSELEPLLRDLDAQVYIIAGDVGVSWAMPLFYENYENIHLLASGMGGSEEENFLIFDVDEQGVQVQAQRLDGQALDRENIENYNLTYYGNLFKYRNITSDR